MVIDPACFARPTGVTLIFRTTYGSDELHAFGMAGRQFRQLTIEGKFVPVAGAKENIEMVAFATPVQVIPNHAQVGADSGYGGYHEMMVYLVVQGKKPLGKRADRHGLAKL